MGFANRPTFRQLEYLLALSELGHFGKAARRCSVSQPALSSQIQKLEEIMGVPLFERGSKGVCLTSAGKEACRRAGPILQEIRELQEALCSFQDPRKGVLRLGVIPTIAPYLLPPALPKLKSCFENLHLEIREDKTGHLLEALHAGELDLCLLALDLEMDFGDLRELSLFYDPFLCLLPKGHPLASHPRIREKDLKAEEFLLLEEGHCLRDQALQLCEGIGVGDLPDLRASSLITLVQMVGMGNGLTLIPQMAIAREIRKEDPVVLRPFEGGGFGRKIGLVYRPGSPRKAFYKELVEVFQMDRKGDE